MLRRGTSETSVHHRDSASLRSDLARLGVTAQGPVLIVVGDAARELSPQEADARRRLVERVIVPVAGDARAIVITGGTDSGVMRELGRSLAEHSPESVLIGVAPDARLKGFGAGSEHEGSETPEPHHRLIRTDGAAWGDEASVLVDVAEYLASAKPVMVAVGGGVGTRRELELALARQWPVLLVESLGGVSDEFAHALERRRPRRRSRRDPLVEALRVARGRGEVRVESASSGPYLARSLRWALSDDLLLREAWTRFAFADRGAVMLKRPTGGGAGALVILSVLTVVVAMVLSRVSADDPSWLPLKYTVTSLPLLAGVILALLERSARGGTWVGLRGAAESVLGEIYRFRSGVSPYRKNAPRALFAEALAGVDDHAGLRIAGDGSGPPTWPPMGLERRIPPGDQLLGPLDARAYDLVRVQDQLQFLARTARIKAGHALVWSVLIYLSAALASLALAVSWRTEPASAVAVVAAGVVAAVLSWRQYQRWEQDAESYRATVLEVRAIRGRWLARTGKEDLATFAGAAEDALAAEGTEWARSIRQAHQGFFEKARGK